MQRFAQCPSSHPFSPCAVRPDDVERFAKASFAAARYVLIALLIGAMLLLAIQWALPLQVTPGASGGKHLAVQPAPAATVDKDLERRTEALLAELSAGPATVDSGPLVLP